MDLFAAPVQASLDVATIEGHVWDKMPDGVAEAIKEEGGSLAAMIQLRLEQGHTGDPLFV